MDCLLSVLHAVKLQEARSERERIISEEKKSTATSSVAVKNRGRAAKQSSQESPSHPQLDTSSQHRLASNTPTPSKTALLPEKVITCNDKMIDTYTCM